MKVKIFKKTLSIFVQFGIVMLIVLLSSLSADTIRFWTTEIQPDRMAKQEKMAADFQKKTGHTVEVIPVEESELGTRATAAFAAGDLPDVIYHTLQYVLPWAEAGILDVGANDEIVRALNRDTFSAGAIQMASYDGMTAAVPVDGWTQLIVYRKDIFKQNGLAAPNSYENITKAIDKLHNPPNMYGFVAATKIDDNFMSQVLEHVLLANGVTPVDNNGFKPLDRTAARESLEFYKTLVKASPPGDLYWKQSREIYFAGKAAMIIWSPFILDEMAGLRDSDPPTINNNPRSRELARRTGFVTSFSGPSNPNGAAWGDVRFFGVTADANTDVAAEFIKYSMNEGYMDTLSIAPEGKFPIRKGDRKGSKKFTTEWSKLKVGVDRKAALNRIYPAATIREIVAGLDRADRWGVKENQLSLASKINNSRILNKVIREYLDDEISVDQAINQINNELSNIK